MKCYDEFTVVTVRQEIDVNNQFGQVLTFLMQYKVNDYYTHRI